jgi:hypothetical protein
LTKVWERLDEQSEANERKRFAKQSNAFMKCFVYSLIENPQRTNQPHTPHLLKSQALATDSTSTFSKLKVGTPGTAASALGGNPSTAFPEPTT